MPDLLTRSHFGDLADSLFWREIRAARIGRDVDWLADAIARDVIAGCGDRRETFAEEIVDNEAWISFLRDLLDDVNSGINPTETIKRRVKFWGLDVAQYEIGRGEHD